MSNVNGEKRYLLVTPAKNEEAFIRDLIESVIRQSLKPVLWVIVDDGSTDRTGEMADNAVAEMDWIEVLHLPPGERRRGQHYAYVCKQGFDYVTEKVKDWDFIGLVDADMILEEEYFEKLITKFAQNEKLGIISGEIYSHGQDKPQIKRSKDEVVGGCRLFRRQCFEDVGGYTVYSSGNAGADTISNTRAKIKGWQLTHMPEVRAVHQRPNTAEKGAWESGYFQAHVMYYFDHHPVLVIGAFFSLLTRRPHFHALAFVFAYMKDTILRHERIPDEEVRRFFRKEKLREVRRNLSIYWGR